MRDAVLREIIQNGLDTLAQEVGRSPRAAPILLSSTKPPRSRLPSSIAMDAWSPRRSDR